MGGTIMDVARAANVSASRYPACFPIIHAHQHGSTATRHGSGRGARIQAAFRGTESGEQFQQNHRPHPEREADQFIRNPFFIGAMAGISQLAQAYDYNVMFAFNPKEREELRVPHVSSPAARWTASSCSPRVPLTSASNTCSTEMSLFRHWSSRQRGRHPAGGQRQLSGHSPRPPTCSSGADTATSPSSAVRKN